MVDCLILNIGDLARQIGLGCMKSVNHPLAINHARHSPSLGLANRLYISFCRCSILQGLQISSFHQLHVKVNQLTAQNRLITNDYALVVL